MRIDPKFVELTANVLEIFVLNTFFQTFHTSNLKILSPVSLGNGTAWMLTGPPVYPADLLSRHPAVPGGGER